MNGLVGGPLLVGGQGPGPPRSPQSGPEVTIAPTNVVQNILNVYIFEENAFLKSPFNYYLPHIA